jgi:hypothetical protein
MYSDVRKFWLVNVLVVAPGSLLGLVNGSLRMAHRCVQLCFSFGVEVYSDVQQCLQ